MTSTFDVMTALKIGLFQAERAAERADALRQINADEKHMYGVAAEFEKSAKMSEVAANYIRNAMTAKADLIAAAPDLLTALQDAADALHIHAPDSWVLVQARAAIAKATGEQA